MENVARKPYPSDVTDEQWELIELVIPAAKPGGRPRGVEMREVINALLYLNRSGCQWDMLPHDLPPKSTTYEYFARWRDDGTWQRIMDALREQARTAAGREATPSAASGTRRRTSIPFSSPARCRRMRRAARCAAGERAS